MENNISKKIIDEIEYFLILGYKYEYEKDETNHIILCKYMDKVNKDWCASMNLRPVPMSLVAVSLDAPYNETTATFICKKENDYLFDESTKAFLMKNSNGKLNDENLKEIEEKMRTTGVDFQGKCDILYDLFSNCNYRLSERIKRNIKREMTHLADDGIYMPSINKDLEKLKIENKFVEEKQL